jgi:hypothetical protein
MLICDDNYYEVGCVGGVGDVKILLRRERKNRAHELYVQSKTEAFYILESRGLAGVVVRVVGSTRLYSIPSPMFWVIASLG